MFTIDENRVSDVATAIPTNMDANVIPHCQSRINANLAPAQPHV